MDKIKFNLLHENEKVKIYKNGYYELVITKYNNFNELKISKTNDNVNNIYIKYDLLDFTLKGIKIESSGYGAIDKEELKQLIKSYQISLETVEEIEKNFL